MFEIIKTLEQLEYSVNTKVLNSSNFGLPQNRERVYFVAFHNSLKFKTFNFPIPPNNPVCLEDILENDPKNAKQLKEMILKFIKIIRLPIHYLLKLSC